MVDITELSDLIPGNEAGRRELAELARIMDKSAYQAGSLIFRENEDSDRLYLIKNGTIKISRTIGENKEKVLLILGRGMYFGNFSMVNGGTHRVTAEALEDSELLVFRKRELDKIAEKNSTFGVRIMSEVLASLFEIYREVDAKFITVVQSLMLGQVLDNFLAERPMEKRNTKLSYL